MPSSDRSEAETTIAWAEQVPPERVIGIGVAGNFAGHLEQAGEASDFTDVKAEAGAPKGVFPFYVPGGDPKAHPLHVFPVSSDTLRLGSLEENHQIEPEVALLFAIEYEGEGAGDGDARAVVGLRPICAMAHNDCSIRREGAKKISEKKNWGAQTKGTAAEGIAVDHFREGGTLDRYRLACFLVRDGEAHAYGVDSPLAGEDGYSYFYDRLHDWLVAKLRDQREGGPLEDVSQWIQTAGHPAHALISVGATRYTDFGETNFLVPGDRIVVALYDAGRYDADEIRALASDENPTSGEGLSLLCQRVVGP